MRTFYSVCYRNPVLAHVLFSTSAVREPLEIFYVCRDQKNIFFLSSRFFITPAVRDLCQGQCAA